MVFEKKYEKFILGIIFIGTTIYLTTTLITYAVYVRPRRKKSPLSEDEKMMITTNKINIYLSGQLWIIILLAIIYWILTKKSNSDIDITSLL